MGYIVNDVSSDVSRLVASSTRSPY